MGRKRINIEEGTAFSNLIFVNEIKTNINEKRIGYFKCSCGKKNLYNISVVKNGGIKRCKDCVNKNKSKLSRKYDVNNIFTKGFNNEINSYILGLFFADGTVRHDNTISLSLKEDDKHILEDIKNIIQPKKNLYYCNVKNGKNQYRLSISDKEIKKIFEKAGCVINKSLILEYPSEKVIDSSFIRGYIDGDGHISRKSLSIMGTKNFLLSLHEKIEKHLCKKIKCRYYQKNKESNCWQLSISFFEDRKLVLDWIYENNPILKLNRKFTEYNKHYVCNEKSRLKKN
jgi:hypothetical protein